MKGKLGKTGILCLALVLALGTMGTGLAWWTETLTITGTVETGTFDSNFILAETNDAQTPGSDDPSHQGKWTCNPGSLSCTWAGDRYNRDVAYLDAEIIDDGLTLNLTLDNGYPCYSPSVCFVVSNDGSIAAKLESVTIIDPQGNSTPVVNGGDKVAMDLDDDGKMDITVWLSKVPNSIGILDPGDTFCGYVYIHVWNEGTDWPYDVAHPVHEVNDASEDAEGTFTITIVLTQFNAH